MDKQDTKEQEILEEANKVSEEINKICENNKKTDKQN